MEQEKEQIQSRYSYTQILELEIKSGARKMIRTKIRNSALAYLSTIGHGDGCAPAQALHVD